MAKIIGLACSLRKESYNGRLMVSRAGNMFDASVVLTDEAIHKQLTQFVAGFVAFVDRE